MAYSGAPASSGQVAFDLSVLDPAARSHMTVAEMLTLYYDLTHDPARTGRTRAEVLRLLNAELKRFVIEAPIVESDLTTTVASGSDTVVMPEAFLAMPLPAVLAADTGERLDYVPTRDIPAKKSTARPYYYTVRGRTIEFDSLVPSSFTVIIRHSSLPGELVDDTDVPNIDREHHEAVVFAAVADSFFADNQPQEAGYWAARAAESRRRASATLTTRQRVHRRRTDMDEEA